MDSKKAHVWSLPLTPEVILSFVSSQVASLMQSYKDHEQYVTTVIIPLAILYMNARSFLNLGLPLPLPPLNFLPAENVWIYIETAVVVVISYVSLLIVSWSYIWLVAFPVIAIGFIVALCCKLSRRRQSNHGEVEGECECESTVTAPAVKKGEGLEAVALVPYWTLCTMGHFHADKFAVSQFLLFFSFMLGALTMMMTRLVGPAPASSELLRKASLVVLLVAVHAVAAELLGENALLYCLPEIAPALLWLSVRLDRGDDDDGDRAVITVSDGGGADRNRIKLLDAATAAALAAALVAAGYVDDVSVLYFWCGKALVSCAVSALLISYVVFMLRQWPGEEQPSLQEAVDFLDVWANVLLKAVVTLLLPISLAAVRLVGLQEPATSAASADKILQRLCQKFLQFII